jgi:hypothetical protein
MPTHISTIKISSVSDPSSDLKWLSAEKHHAFKMVDKPEWKVEDEYASWISQVRIR